MKNGNSPDLVVTADDTTLKWLSSLFGCSEQDAVSILVNAAGKKSGEDGNG